MKKKLILILSLMLLFCLSACSTEDEKNFEYDKSTMIDMTKSIVTTYKDMSGSRADYLLSDGENYEKTAIAGFRQAQTTDKVGSFVGFDTSEDAVTFENGTKGKVLCSIIVKFKERDVRFSVSYSENKLFKARYDEEYSTMEYYASMYGYESPDDFVQKEEALSAYGYRTDSAEHFITDLLMMSQTEPVLPYTPLECEVSTVYSKSELLMNGAKNMGVGMGVVFIVLIFIACIIYLLRFVPKLLGKEAKKPKPAAVKVPTAPKADQKKEAAPSAAPAMAAAPVPNVEQGEEVTDGELIAVITAALHAYLSENASAGSEIAHPPAYTASNDKLVVRSIRRVS